jgi:hypothetical protein
LKVDALSCYTTKIIAAPERNYVYMATPFSIYLLKVDDYTSKRVRITQITTSSAGNAIKEYFSKDPNKQFCFEQTDTPRSEIDCVSHELKLDGSRFQALSNNRLLMWL